MLWAWWHCVHRLNVSDSHRLCLPISTTVQTLAQVLPYQRERLASQLMKADYLPSLLDLFKVGVSRVWVAVPLELRVCRL